jgi:hypothetical protein
MTDTATVTELRPKTKAKGKDNTAALRQRRRRAKRKPPSKPSSPASVAEMAQPENPHEIKADVTVGAALSSQPPSLPWRSPLSRPASPSAE